MLKRKEKALKECYEKILNEADKIDGILDGSIFRDSIYELVEKQTKEFKIKLK